MPGAGFGGGLDSVCASGSRDELCAVDPRNELSDAARLSGPLDVMKDVLSARVLQQIQDHYLISPTDRHQEAHQVLVRSADAEGFTVFCA